MTVSLSFYKNFKPNLIPKKMLEYGVFGVSYLKYILILLCEKLSFYVLSYFL